MPRLPAVLLPMVKRNAPRSAHQRTFEDMPKKNPKEQPSAAEGRVVRKTYAKRGKSATRNMLDTGVHAAADPIRKRTAKRNPKLSRAPITLHRRLLLRSAAPVSALPPVPSRKVPGVGNNLGNARSKERTGAGKLEPCLFFEQDKKGYAHPLMSPNGSLGLRKNTAASGYRKKGDYPVVSEQLPPSAIAPLPPPGWFYTFLKRLSRSCSPARPYPLAVCRPVF